jgi:hypothetical protein
MVYTPISAALESGHGQAHRRAPRRPAKEQPMTNEHLRLAAGPPTPDTGSVSPLRRAAFAWYRWLLLIFLLAFLAQSLLADLGGSNAFFGGLHALDGLAILGIAGYLYGWSRRHGSWPP